MIAYSGAIETPAYVSNAAIIRVTVPVDGETDDEVGARILFEHKLKCQQAFRRPPKRCGRGKLPPRKWGLRR